MPRFTAADGTGLHFTDAGAGLPILCLAGLTRNSRDFDHVAPRLTGNRLIRLDYRGRGQSDWANPDSYTIAQESQDVLALLDHLGLARVAILGTSRGGLIGMGLAAFAPDRIIGLCLNDIGPQIAPAGLDKIKGYLGIPPKQRTYAEAAATRAATWTQFQNVPMERWLAEVRNQFEETADGLRLRYDPDLRRCALLPAQNPVDPWPVFAAAGRKPLALIRGVNSDILTLQTADEMQRLCPGLIRAEVPGRGHVPFLDEPEALAALHSWIEQLA